MGTPFQDETDMIAQLIIRSVKHIDCWIGEIDVDLMSFKERF